MLGIDVCEGSHYLLRLHLRSTGPARNATTSANTAFLQQVAADHQRRHECRPFRSLANVIREGVAENAIVLAPAAPKARGTPAPLRFMNSKMAAFKQVRAPDRKLTPDERETRRAKHAKEWEDMGEDGQESWRTLCQASTSSRQVVPAAPGGPPRPQPTSNVWGNPVDSHAAYPPAAAVVEYQKHTKSQREALACKDPAMLIKGPVPARAATVPALSSHGNLGSIASCWEGKKNVCRHVLGDTLSKQVDGLTSYFNVWVRALGDSADDCSALALLRGTGLPVGSTDGPAAEVDAIVLLALRRLKPVMQVFARCTLVGDKVARTFACPPPPFQAEVVVSPSRLCFDRQVLGFITSDELALELARLRSSWSLIPLAWVEPPGVASLLVFNVTGMGDPVVVRVPRPRAPGVSNLLKTLSTLGGDPAVDAPAQEFVGDGADGDWDDQLVAGMPADFVADVVEETEELHGIGSQADVDLAAALQPDDPGGGEESDVVEEAEAAEELTVGGATREAEQAALVASAVVDEEGYVTSPIEPYASRGSLGRITSFQHGGRGRPNVSCKCSLHDAGCSSPLRKRDQYTDAMFVAWLLGGTYEPGCSRGRNEELGREHRSLWAPIVDGLRTRPVVPHLPSSSIDGRDA